MPVAPWMLLISSLRGSHFLVFITHCAGIHMVPTEDFIPSEPIPNHSQTWANREQMLAIVCHDMKNPLCIIQLEAQMLLKVAEQHCMNLFSEEVKNQANRILKTTDRLKTLIVDLIDKNKSEEGLFTLHKMDCDLSQLFQEVIEANRPLVKEKNLSIKLNDQIHDFMMEYGPAHGLKYVLGYTRGGGILYATDSLDITDHVLEGLNEKYRGK